MSLDQTQLLVRLVEEFNKSGRLEALISVFANNNLSTEEILNIVNSKGSHRRLAVLRFSLLKFDPEYIVYISTDGEVVFSHTDSESLHSILRQMYQFGSEHTIEFATHALRTAILIAGRGTIKTYEAYAKTDVSSMSPAEVKQALIDPSFWTPQRNKLHEEVLHNALENARILSTFINTSAHLESGLYCLRGTVASGKSTLITKILQEDEKCSNEALEGVINTDKMKRVLMRATGNAIGPNLVGYLFHDEASMLNKRLISQIRSENLLYALDQRMQDASDLQELLDDALSRKLPVIILALIYLTNPLQRRSIKI